MNLAGEVYAANATVKFSSNNNAQISGNGGTIPGALIARDLVAGGNGSLNVAANSGGATGDLSTTLIDSVGGSSINAATGTLSAGSSLLYTITVANFGPAAVTGAILTDSFPAAVASDTYTITASGGAAERHTCRQRQRQPCRDHRSPRRRLDHVSRFRRQQRLGHRLDGRHRNRRLSRRLYRHQSDE